MFQGNHIKSLPETPGLVLEVCEASNILLQHLSQCQMSGIEKQIELLYSKDSAEAYEVLKELQKTSSQSDQVYVYLDEFISMLDSENSYLRSRGIALISANAKWDRNDKINVVIDSYLQHIVDVKPVTARCCIKDP